MKNWTPLMWIYLLLAIAGLIIPWYFNLQFLMQTGSAISSDGFMTQCLATPASTSFTTDLFIGASAFTVWMIVESRRLKMKGIWLYVIFTCLIAFAFICPLFLLMRERKLRLVE